MRKIEIPNLSLVCLIGASGSGKSSFARKHFLPTEILSSDEMRGRVADDENDQTASAAAFDVLYYIAAKRLTAGRLTVIDATNVRPEERRKVVELAREHHVLPVAIVLNLPQKICHERNASRPDRSFGPHVVRNQIGALRQSLYGLKREGFSHVFRFDSIEEIDEIEIARVPLWVDKRGEKGPFDIIGDLHGCFDETVELMQKLGYRIDREPGATGVRFRVTPPEGRRAIFLGDLVDRGPNTPDCLRLVMDMVEDGKAFCVPGNHEEKLLKKLRGRDVKPTHGLAETLAQLEKEPPEFLERIAAFIDSRISHYVLDGGKLVVAHAGMKESMQGRGSSRVRSFALYGETTGETDDYGLPVRWDWAAEYRGKAMVVYGHTPVLEAEWLNNTICIDTGCVFGGQLTALRYPEREIVSWTAQKVHYASPKPLGVRTRTLSAQHEHDDLLDLDDVLGKRIVQTSFGSVTIREDNAVAALEVMSRFAIDPKWLIYLPPTMSPSETSQRDGYLEYPTEAFEYFRRQGAASVVCEEKHMGSRAVVVLAKDEGAARRRFGVSNGIGVIYTRTGRKFFSDDRVEEALLIRLQRALESADFWNEFSTEWVALDAELLPWSAKAMELIRGQYAATGAAATAALDRATALLDRARSNGRDVGALIERTEHRRGAAVGFVEAYRRYCWSVASPDDLRLAPFHLLATEGALHTTKDHRFHMETLHRLCREDEGLLRATPYRIVDLSSAAAEREASIWWEELTAKGGEGMVVKSTDFIIRGPKGWAQPAIKCRGPEYLRIIYGPEYRLPENLDRLRRRGLSAKRALASREFALGIEALDRFVKKERKYVLVETGQDPAILTEGSSEKS